MDQKFCRNRSILLRFRDKRVFAFTADIQDGCQKWRENNFGEKLPVDSADTLWVKNFVEITLSCSVSEINAFLHFMQKFKMADKSDGKIIFWGSCQKTADTRVSKILSKLQIPCVSKILSKLLYLTPFPR